MDEIEKVREWVREMKEFLEHYDIEKKRDTVYAKPSNGGDDLEDNNGRNH